MKDRARTVGRKSRIWCTVLSAIWLTAGAVAAEPQVRIEIEEPWACVFAGEPSLFHVSIESEIPFEGRLMWGLTAGEGVVARGEQEVQTAASNRHGIRLEIPEVRAGVVAPLTLAVSVASSDGARPPVSLKRTLYAFHEDPFVDQQRWIEARNLHLFDPVGDTRARLEEFAVPHADVFRLDEIALLENTLLVIGEGVSLYDYPALMELVVSAAENGNAVLWLSPRDGEWVLPGAEESDLKMPTQMAFAREEMIRRLDKRLDSDGWPPGGPVFDRSMTIRSSRGMVVNEIARNREGWPWFEAWFAESSGRLIVTTLPVIERWDDGPVPRYLLMKMFEYGSQKEKTP